MKNTFYKLILFVGFLIIPLSSNFAMEVAITVDDLPANGKLPHNVTRMDVAKKIISVFKKHHISGIYGLINGEKIKNEQNGIEVLNEWIKSGNYLGNHTFDHIDLAKTNSHRYIKNIQKNEMILSQLMIGNDYRYFRYPFLSEGSTQEKRDTIRQFLFENSYKIAPVTVDFFEYEWNDPYVRCLNNRDGKSIEWLKGTYLSQANNALIIAHELSTMLFKKDIKNVLLIHINSFTAEMLDELLTSYENQGVKFITLSEALNDPVYKINPNVIRERAYTFLNQVPLSKHLKNPDVVEKLYESLPEDKLNQLCR